MSLIGVTQSKYDAVEKERDEFKAQITTIEKEKTDALCEKTKLETELQAANTSIAELTTAKATAEKEAETLKASIVELTTAKATAEKEMSELKAENERLRQLPGATTAIATSEKEAATGEKADDWDMHVKNLDAIENSAEKRAYMLKHFKK